MEPTTPDTPGAGPIPADLSVPEKLAGNVPQEPAPLRHRRRFSVDPSMERRRLHRVPCRIVVTQTGRGHLLGEIHNLSLSGVYLVSKDQLSEGHDLSITFPLGDGKADMVIPAKVAWRSGEGLGLQFLHLTASNRRRLRRTIVELSSLAGHRETAIQLHDLDQDAAEPITRPADIAALLDRGLTQGLSFTLIAAGRPLRETGIIAGLKDSCLLLRMKHQSELRVQEHLFAWMTLDFVSYSFEVEVVEVHPLSLALTVPTAMHYSERRTNRRILQTDGKTLSLPLPWKTDQKIHLPIIDISPGGLSFRADPAQMLILPGTPLKGAAICQGDEETPLPSPVVRHLSLVEHPTEAPWLKVGVAYQVERVATPVEEYIIGEGRHHGLAGKVYTWFRGQLAKLSYLYHTRLKRPGADETPFTVVRYPNRRGQQVTALLNVAFPEEGRVRAPLVIVSPGYGGRKEVMSALAMTLVENFQLAYRNLAVLRFDNTNNLGESFKDPDCKEDGYHTLHYTMSAGVDDLLGTLDWAQNNRHIDPTDIVVISISLSSVPVRRLLTCPEAGCISRWIAFMGVADAQDAALHAAGNIDMYGNHLRGVKNGIISLLGCLVDADYFCQDLEDHHLGTIEDARRDMAEIRAAVTWIVGRHDGWLDPERVRDIVSVKGKGAREIIEVDAGHVPRSGDEALAEFALITRIIHRHLFGQELDVTTPSAGWLAAVSRQEWQRVRRTQLDDRAAYWKTYLLGDNDLGFDIVELSPAYQQFVQLQAALADPGGKRVLDLGAGTGNVSAQILELEPRELVALDIVPEALERLRIKSSGTQRLQTVVADADGNSLVAMRRWVEGELASLAELSGRIPGIGQSFIDPILKNYTPELHALLRGADLDVASVVRRARLPSSFTGPLADLNLLARMVAGKLELLAIRDRLQYIDPSILDSPGGLPFPRQSFDCVVSSLVLSYLSHPEDTLSEIHRVLVPSGRLVLSTMKPDADISKLVLDLIDYIGVASEGELPSSHSREVLLKAARDYISSAASLVRLEEEGLFRFFSHDRLLSMVARAGFENAEISSSFGNPPQALVVTCRRP